MDESAPRISRTRRARSNGRCPGPESIIEPTGGVIVAEFFDVGQSRSLPWKRRPEASALLEALRRPDRGFEAVVVGEPARAFYGNNSATRSQSSPTSPVNCGSLRSVERSIPARMPTTCSWVFTAGWPRVSATG